MDLDPEQRPRRCTDMAAWRRLCNWLARQPPASGFRGRPGREHPFPAAVDDAVSGYRYLLSRGIRPGRIAIAGDSAGGGLVVAAMLAIREAGAQGAYFTTLDV